MRFLFLFATVLTYADITGFVRDSGAMPIPGARVRIQTSSAAPAISGADGSFTLVLASGSQLTVTAALPYSPHAATNYISGGVEADNGDSGVVIVLAAIPTTENSNYFPIKARTPDGCGDCHPTQLSEWEQSRHADTAQNTWVNDIFANWSAQNPGQTGYCASCHAPAADSQSPGNVYLDQLNSLPALDRISAKEGVNCASCHQIDQVNDNYQALHLNGNATMRFPQDGIGGSGTHEYVWGPLDDVDYPYMKAVYQPQFQESSFCASCHEYSNPFNGTPAQSTFSEWQASVYADPMSGQFSSCQDCHMAPSVASQELCDPPLGFGNGPTRGAGSHRSHDISGTSQAGLAAAVDLRIAAVFVRNGQLTVEVEVANSGAGHGFPSGITLRNAILRVLTTGTHGLPLAQLSGPQVPFYGSDNNGTPEVGDWAGLPGRGYARVLRDSSGNKPVLFIDAVAIDQDTRIAAGAIDRSTYSFDLSQESDNGQDLVLEVALDYRRAWRATVVSYGWQTDNRGLPIELPLHHLQLTFSYWALEAAMWRDDSAPPNFDTDGNGLIDIRDLLATLP